MNRAIVLSRPDPDAADLHRTAKAIVNTSSRSEASELMLRAVSDAYVAYRQMQQQDQLEAAANFHSLRDYYALVRTNGRAPEPDDSHVAAPVSRNFGGLTQSSTDFQQILDKKVYPVTFIEVQRTQISPLTLVCSNLRDMRARHLMVITRHDAALCLLKLPQVRKALCDPVVMIASHFKEDISDEYAYQQLSKIILYMQAVRQLILKDFDHIYGNTVTAVAVDALWLLVHCDCW